jgi:glycosyltransferase involved in cell wall biosynthesis
MRSEVALVIPVYNEGRVIRDVVNAALRKYSNIICVNDGSTDDSLEQLLTTKAYIVDHPINMGQGAAIQTGVEFGRLMKDVKYFVTYDADGQHRLEDVDHMLKTLKNNDVDIVFGSRFTGATEDMPVAKKLLLKAAVMFSNITSGLKLTDTHNGLRAFNRRVADELQITLPDMSHASEILEIVARKKYKYTEVPVTIRYTDYSRSKGQSMINAVNIALDTILRKVAR